MEHLTVLLALWMIRHLFWYNSNLNVVSCSSFSFFLLERAHLFRPRLSAYKHTKNKTFRAEAFRPLEQVQTIICKGTVDSELFSCFVDNSIPHMCTDAYFPSCFERWSRRFQKCSVRCPTWSQFCSRRTWSSRLQKPKEPS